MRAHLGVASFLSALLIASSANAEAARLTDEDVERLLERLEKEIPACAEAGGQAPLRELENAVRTMRERFDEKSSANEEALSFLLMARMIPEGEEGACARLREGVDRLAETYHVDRKMAPPLWRARRMNDSELARVLASLGEEVPAFTRGLREVVELLDPCTVVEGEREEAVATASALSRAAADLRKAVEKDREASPELTALLSRAGEVRGFLERHSITRVLRDTWGPVERDLSLVATAFGVEEP